MFVLGFESLLDLLMEKSGEGDKLLEQAGSIDGKSVKKGTCVWRGYRNIIAL
jgi:hypothetical protein